MGSRVSGTASLGMKISLGNKKGFTQYDHAAPHYSITFERTYEDSLSDDELVLQGDHLSKLARTLVEKKINEDVKAAKDG